MKAHRDKIVAAIVLVVLVLMAMLYAANAHACEVRRDSASVYVNLLAAENPPYCHKTSVVGELGLDLRLTTFRVFGVPVDYNIGYQHESCYAEEMDAADMDAIKFLGLEARF